MSALTSYDTRWLCVLRAQMKPRRDLRIESHRLQPP